MAGQVENPDLIGDAPPTKADYSEIGQKKRKLNNPPRAHIRLHLILGRDTMPYIAAKSVLVAKNNSLPDYWEFFYVSEKNRRD